MSWPTQIWDPKNPLANAAGLAPYAPPADPSWLVGKDKGLPDDWQDYDIKSNVWDALDNPLYAVAAEAKGIDFEEFRGRVNTQLGPEDDYQFTTSKMVTVESRNRDGNGRPLRQDGYTYNETAYEEALDEWKNNDDGDSSFANKPNPKDFTGAGPQLNEFGFSGKSGSIHSDMKKMFSWLNGIKDKSKSKGDYGVIASGPQGSDYGIVGDIWEHYGLDKAPEAPKELNDSFFSYQENFAQATSYGRKDEWINAAIDLAANPDPSSDLEVSTTQLVEEA